MIDRFMAQPEFDPRSLSPTAGLLSAVIPNTEHPVTSASDTGLPAASNPATGHPAVSSSGTGLLATSMPYIVTSSLNTGHPATSQFPAFSVGLDSLNTSQLLVSQTTNSLTVPKLSTNTSTPVTPPKLASGTIYQVISSTQEPLHTSLSLGTSQHPSGVIIRSMNPAFPSVYELRPEADVCIPKTSPATAYHELRPSPFPVRQNHPPLCADSVHQIAEALAKVTQLQRLPQAKPSVFRGDEVDTKFFIWETAFNALIDSAPNSAQQKLYFLNQHLDGKAKKVVEQLQYMVGANPEIA